jgi:hypothetical protein
VNGRNVSANGRVRWCWGRFRNRRRNCGNRRGSAFEIEAWWTRKARIMFDVVKSLSAFSFGQGINGTERRVPRVQVWYLDFSIPRIPQPVPIKCNKGVED